MPLGEYLDLHPHDRDTIESLRAHRAESCGGCGSHPAVWSKRLGGNPHALIAKWRYCRPCDLLEQAREQGPRHEDGTVPESSTGWHLELVRNPYLDD